VMRLPFEKLMQWAAELDARADADVTLGDLARRWDVPTARVMDAIDAVRVLRGERTYLPVGD
jgi:hypothetical protein